MTESAIPVSVFIIALNEADRIGRAIESVRGWVREVIVVDSGSVDGTPEVAERLGARVIFNEWQGYGPQKRFAEEQCTCDWLLNLDADEEVSEGLRAEIAALFASGEPAASGYFIPIREILPAEREAPRFGRSVRPVRLYDRRKGRYAESTVHDRVQMAAGAATSKLTQPLWHRSSRSISHSVEKLNRYSGMQAEDLRRRKGVRLKLKAQLVVEFPWAFFKAYVIRGYALKGMPGFINAVVFAFSRFLRLAKYYELVRGGK